MTYQVPPAEPFVLPIEESSQVGDARRSCVALARSIGMPEVACGNVALLATELCTNLVKYAKGGELIVRSLHKPCGQVAGKDGIELTAVDRGPGIPDRSFAFQDGFSTSGSVGGGLGAVRRLSGEWDLYTQAARGTVMVCRLWNEPRARPSDADPCSPPFECGVVSLPKPGETMCGDGWIVHHEEGDAGSRSRIVVMIVDGLGHGPQAAEAATRAQDIFQQRAAASPADQLEAIHAGMRHTRGAAVAIAELLPDAGQLRFAGVGNIAASISDGEASRGLMSNAGTAGVEARRIQQINYPWASHSLLLMHSDGLSTSTGIRNYPGLRQHHPATIAGVLYRDYRRLRDDATVLVLRGTGPARNPGVGK